MKRFTQLYIEIDSTTRTTGKVEALVRYFRDADAADAAWALAFLSGRKVPRAVSTSLLRPWVAEETQLPLWLIEECYDKVGDLAETLALLYPDREKGDDLSLHRLVHERLMSLRALPDPDKRALLVETWDQMNFPERLVWNKLIMGAFRVGVARTLVERALARVASVPQPLIAHRLSGDWEPTASGYQALLAPADAASVSQAQFYPFFLAHPLEGEPDSLGSMNDWLVEWKWDGIRAQFIRRQGETRIWSRAEELVTDRFPEIAALAPRLPDGIVLDGEILAWEPAPGTRDVSPPADLQCPARPGSGRPLPFAALQRRIGRSTVDSRLLKEVPIVLLAFDLLELNDRDLRALPLFERRAALEQIVSAADHPALQLSPSLTAATWEDLGALRARCRSEAAEGVMVKRMDSAYGVGRPRGDWWKWKIAPYTIDAVLTAAQPGHGERANLFTDYTFGVWHEGKLITIAKAFSGLTDAEIRKVDAFVRRHTLERHGPVRTVEPLLVFELAFEGVQASTRHKAGLAVRSPHIARWRTDKKSAEADTLDVLRSLLAGSRPGSDRG